MAVKPGAGEFRVKEQIIEDLPSGLTFQFVHMPDSDAPYRLRITGDLPFGNREILFGKNGEEAGSGTALVDACPATWIREVRT